MTWQSHHCMPPAAASPSAIFTARAPRKRPCRSSSHQQRGVFPAGSSHPVRRRPVSKALPVPRGTVALVDRGWLETGQVSAPRTISVFAGFRLPREVISVAVRWYLRYGLSYRDVGELLAERGVTVDHVTVYRWVQRFTCEFIEAARPCRHRSE